MWAVCNAYIKKQTVWRENGGLGAYGDGGQKPVILHSMSEQNLLHLAPMIFKVFQESLDLKLQQKKFSTNFQFNVKQVRNCCL